MTAEAPQPVVLQSQAHRCVKQWNLWNPQSCARRDMAHISVGTLPGGDWYVDHTGFATRRVARWPPHDQGLCRDRCYTNRRDTIRRTRSAAGSYSPRRSGPSASRSVPLAKGPSRMANEAVAASPDASVTSLCCAESHVVGETQRTALLPVVPATPHAEGVGEHVHLEPRGVKDRRDTSSRQRSWLACCWAARTSLSPSSICPPCPCVALTSNINGCLPEPTRKSKPRPSSPGAPGNAPRRLVETQLLSSVPGYWWHSQWYAYHSPA